MLALFAIAAGGHEDCPAAQIVKVAGALDPPPPPPVHGVMQPGCGGDGGLKTVTLAVTLAEVVLAKRSVVIVAWMEVEVIVPRVNFFCAPPIVQFIWEACAGSEFARKLVPVKVIVSGSDP